MCTSRPSACDLVLEAKPLVEFSWNSLQEVSTKSCGAGVPFVKIGSIRFMCYFWWLNVCTVLSTLIDRFA
jgi:hypothetical protein